MIRPPAQALAASHTARRVRAQIDAETVEITPGTCAAVQAAQSRRVDETAAARAVARTLLRRHGRDELRRIIGAALDLLAEGHGDTVGDLRRAGL